MTIVTVIMPGLRIKIKSDKAGASHLCHRLPFSMSGGLHQRVPRKNRQGKAEEELESCQQPVERKWAVHSCVDSCEVAVAGLLRILGNLRRGKKVQIQSSTSQRFWRLVSF